MALLHFRNAATSSLSRGNDAQKVLWLRQESGFSEVALVAGNKAEIQVFLGPQEIQTTHLICTAPSMLFIEDWLTVETKPLLYFIWSHNSEELKYTIPKEAEWSPFADPYIQPQVLAANFLYLLSTYWVLTCSRQFSGLLLQNEQDKYSLPAWSFPPLADCQEGENYKRCPTDVGTDDTHPIYTLSPLPHLL